MSAVRSSEGALIRKELAQLLRRLRAIRRSKLSEDELAEQVNLALAEAATIRRFVTITAAAETRVGAYLTGCARVDKRALSEAGFGRRDDMGAGRGELAARRVPAIAASNV